MTLAPSGTVIPLADPFAELEIGTETYNSIGLLNLDANLKLWPGDCRILLAKLEPDSIDAVVTDPPYHLTTGKRGGSGEKSVNLNSPHGRARITTGFMNKIWDGGDIAFQRELWTEVLRVLKPGGHVLAFGGTRTYHRLATAIEDAGFEIRDMVAWLYGTGFPKSLDIGEGRGTALKPAHEPICLARKPLSEATVAANMLRWRTGALNIDATRIAVTGSANAIGRFPANLCHDGSPEVLDVFPYVRSGTGAVKKATSAGYQANAYGRESRAPGTPNIEYGDEGSAARFFYSAKAGKADRQGSKHPTVKPVALMRWLVRLITPPRGLVLDPFAGTGTTGLAALAEGRSAILAEAEPEYQRDIARRFFSDAAVTEIFDLDIFS